MSNESTRRLKSELAAVGETQISFARKCGLSRNTISDWFREDRIPPWVWFAIDGIRWKEYEATKVSDQVDWVQEG